MIFISYRREDTKEVVTHLHRRLVDRYGKENVFVDFSDIPAGSQWPEVLQYELRRRPVLLAVIGRIWGEVKFTSGKMQGRPRLDDPNDWVREEICTAINSDKHVVVVPVDDAVLPETEWKCELDELTRLQFARLRNQGDFETDFGFLCGWLEKQVPELIVASMERQSGIAAKNTRSLAEGSWTPAVPYPIQPAPHFSGREQLLKDLTKWAAEGSNATRVVALVAAGGTGKTSIAERVLNSLNCSNTFGIFVWSFYENPRTEAFLRQACAYFAGKNVEAHAGNIEQLQLALAGNQSHLLILDGLELVQSTGSFGHNRGEIEDPLVKRLLRWLAAGHGTRTKALITSRFPVPDLNDWNAGFREHHLDDLPNSTALEILRAWGVKGTNAQLTEALRPLQDPNAHTVHALSVSMLGSYLGKRCGGDVSQTAKLSLITVVDVDKSARLKRILAFYSKKLSPVEIDLLARLSMFPRGISAAVIECLIKTGGKVAGRLAGLDVSSAMNLLDGLRDLGLAFRYEGSDGTTYTAHPFLRQFFEAMSTDGNRRQIHETVRTTLALNLTEQPVSRPHEPADLDRYEQLIEATRLAGQAKRAFDLYRSALGEFTHLSDVLGENARGLRIVSGFGPDVDFGSASATLTKNERFLLLSDWGLFAENLGEFGAARRVLEIALHLMQKHVDHVNLGRAWLNLADVEMQAGRWIAARAAAAKALGHALKADDGTIVSASHAYAATVCVRLGELDEARDKFQTATRTGRERQLYSNGGIWHAEFELLTGGGERARTLTNENWDRCKSSRWHRDQSICETILGRCALLDRSADPRQYLSTGRSYANRSSHVEVALRCYDLAAKIAYRDRDFDLAIAEASNGIELADSCSSWRWSIDLRLELSKAHVAAGRPKHAIEPATKALAMSADSDSQYAWGMADGSHWLGVAFARVGDDKHKKIGCDYLQRALERRRSLEHGELKETEIELERLKA